MTKNNPVLYWVSQDFPQICTALLKYRFAVFLQMQYRFAENYETLSIMCETSKPIESEVEGVKKTAIDIEKRQNREERQKKEREEFMRQR